MTLSRYAKKRDSAEAAIVAALESVGAEVHRLDRPADLLVYFRFNWYVLEVKTGRGKSGAFSLDKRQVEQQEFLKRTRTPIVRTPAEAFHAIGITPSEAKPE